ncbi:MAG TPA: glycosyltransferase family 4 protein [Solirubrobacteraceae bacterium]
MTLRLLAALDRRLTVVGVVDFAPRSVAKLALAGATFRPGRAAWRARFHTSLMSHRMLSRTLKRGVRARKRDYDIALQVHGWVTGQPRPYALYVDQTRLMAERGWPRWMPLTRAERSSVLRLERHMYGAAAHVLVMGTPARDSLTVDYGVDPRRITVVGGGLMFNALPGACPLTSEPTIMFVGRDFERKGGDCLLHAFALVRAELPAATLHLVGVRRQFEQPGVTSHGMIRSRERMTELYRRTRAFCMPSRYEPYGFVFAEAMAHGVPCIGTTVQSIPEILDHGRAGMLVAPGDVRALADSLLALLVDHELASALGAAGRSHVVRCLTWDHVAARAAPALEAAASASS